MSSADPHAPPSGDAPTPPSPPAGSRDWVETIVAIAARLGANPVRLRWKLHGLRKGAGEVRGATELHLEHAQYEHRVCVRCALLNHREDHRCARCGAALRPLWVERLARLGVIPRGATAGTLLLAALILVCYARTLSLCGLGALLMPTTQCTVALGGNVGWSGPFAAEAGLWRLATAMFLHIGLLHLAFNLTALWRIGAEVEATFGTGRMLALYVASGLVGNYLSARFGGYPVAAGASGAIMGLGGVAAGWGQRHGGPLGRHVRNHMLRWVAYTMFFGLFLPFDNWAHGGGFVSGFALGFIARPAWLQSRATSLTDIALGGAGALAALFATGLVLFGTSAPDPAATNPMAVPRAAQPDPEVASPRPLPPFEDPESFEAGARLLETWTGAPRRSFSPPEPANPAPNRNPVPTLYRFDAHAPLAQVILAQAADRFLARGLHVVRLESNAGHRPDVLGLLPSADPLQVVAWVGTDGNAPDKSNADVVAWLRALHADQPFRLTGAGVNFIEGRFLGPIENPVALAKRVHAFSPDVVEQGAGDVVALARHLKDSGRLYLWWD